MLSPDTPAPDFELPGAHRGEIRQFRRSDYEGEDVVVLSFYPADFSPTCTEEVCSLRDVDLLTLQRDVTILGISPDSAYSHRAFAERHDLDFPLLSDSVGEIAEDYGVLHDELGGHKRVPKRAMFVVDHRGVVQYAWSTDDPSVLPDLDEVREEIAAVQDDGTAIERYRLAEDHHRTGRSELDRGLSAYEDEEWGVAGEAFSEAEWYLDQADDEFDSARRFAESAAIVDSAAHAKEKSVRFRRAAKWYAEAASHRDDGDEEWAADYRSDAVEALDAAREMDDVPDLYSLSPPAAE